MARLLVFRGDSLIHQLPLTHQTIRIGRSPNNDLVLDDQQKSVSREHAEIRFENGGYVVVDRNSNNGVWVSGARVPYVVLEPDVAASIGPFRLMLDESGGEDTPSAIGGDQQTEYLPRSDVSSGPVKPPLPPPPPAAFAAHKWLLGGILALVVGAVGFGIFKVFDRDDPPPLDAEVRIALASIENFLKERDCGSAAEEMESLVATHGSNEAVGAMKARVDACNGPPPVAPQPDPISAPLPEPSAEEIAAHLRDAAAMISKRECAAALSDHIDPVLAADPANAEALDLRAKATACPRPAPPPVTTTPPAAGGCPGAGAREIPPEKGGLKPEPCESPDRYQSRVSTLRGTYDEALAAAASGSYQRGIELLDQVLREGGERYLDAAARRAEAMKAWAKQLYASAQQREKANEWDRAVEELNRAHKLDATINIAADLKRISDTRTAIGQKACRSADAQHSFYGKTPEAERYYRTAVQALPADDPCVVKAKELFPQLRK